MKKLLLLIVTLIFTSCYTTVNQIELYGVIEDIVYTNNYYKVKTWCKQKGKYYYITTNRRYNKGDIIKIK